MFCPLKCGTIIQWSLGMTLRLQDLASAVTREMSQIKISQYHWTICINHKSFGWYNFWKKNPVRNAQRCYSAAEWLQEALQKSCKSAGLQQPQILAAVESPLTAINSAFAAVQKIPESRSALQSGCKVASKTQRMLLTVMAYHSLVPKKRNAGSNNTIITIHGRGVDVFPASASPLQCDR